MSDREERDDRTFDSKEIQTSAVIEDDKEIQTSAVIEDEKAPVDDRIYENKEI